MKKMKAVFSAFRETHRLEKRLLPISIAVAVVMAVMPFINIWFTSKIIDLLDLKAKMSELVLYIGLAVGINLVLFFFQLFSKRYVFYVSFFNVQQRASEHIGKALQN